MADKVTYKVPAHLKGCSVGTTPPTFKRNVADPGVFKLDECSQKELGYLFEVIKYPLEIA